MSNPRKPPLTGEQVGQVYRTLASEHLASHEQLVRERTWRRLEERLGASERATWLQQLRDGLQHGTRALFSVRSSWIAAVAALVLTVTGVVYFQETRDLRFEVIGAQLEGDSIHSGRVPALLQFSDGSELQLGAESHVSVNVTGRRGAITRLSEADLRVDVHHAEATDWRFFAGPFEVRVIGTRFDLGWRAGRFSLAMREGQVRVISPRREWTLRAGEQLQLNERDANETGTTDGKELTALEPDSAGGDTAAARAARRGAAGETRNGADARDAALRDGLRLDPDPSFETSSRSARRTSRAVAGRHRAAAETRAEDSANDGLVATDTTSTWRQMLAKGEFATIVSQARKQGVDAVLMSRGSDDLVALAQAARYEKELGLARKVWSSVKSRFSGSNVGRDAVFFLGRIAEQAGDSGVALDYYSQYLKETRRGGNYAPEALGRRMVILKHSRGEADVEARAYLAQFPSGPYAKLARELISVKPSANASQVRVSE